MVWVDPPSSEGLGYRVHPPICTEVTGDHPLRLPMPRGLHRFGGFIEIPREQNHMEPDGRDHLADHFPLQAGRWCSGSV